MKNLKGRVGQLWQPTVFQSDSFLVTYFLLNCHPFLTLSVHKLYECVALSWISESVSSSTTKFCHPVQSYSSTSLPRIYHSIIHVWVHLLFLTRSSYYFTRRCWQHHSYICASKLAIRTVFLIISWKKMCRMVCSWRSWLRLKETDNNVIGSKALVEQNCHFFFSFFPPFFCKYLQIV